jgi:hypothetical protein
MAPLSSSSPRRFDIDKSNQPILQFIATTIPFAILCVWFLYSTARRPYIDCYESVDNVTDDNIAANYSENCSQYVPLKQFAIVFLLLAFLWGLLVAYLLYYVPRRHQLIREYLSHGTTVIGDVYFNRHNKMGGLCGRLLSSTQQPAYGYAVYPHNHPTTNGGTDKATAEPVLLRRQVRVFERYTRERAAIIILPGLPYSGQPKMDLEIDRDVTDLNQHRLQLLSRYAIGWLVFCVLAPIFIVETIRSLDQKNQNNNNGATNEDGGEDVDNDPPPWQPDIDLHHFPSWYYLMSFVVLPITVLLWTMILWWWHRRWMTYQHNVLLLSDNEAVGGGGDYYERQRDHPTGCCFDDEDCESIEIKDYQPPRTNVVERDAKRGEKGATV